MHNTIFLAGIEVLSVILNLAFLYYLIREKRICWVYGVLASLFSIFLMYANALYSEALLYVFYVLMGVYGYLSWGADSQKLLRVREWPIRNHLVAFLLGISLLLGMGVLFDRRTDADYPYHDAFSTSFSFVATFMETRKILSGWLYWVVLNLFTSWLYFQKDMYLYAGLMLVYAVFSLVGFYQWKKEWNTTD